MIEAIVTLVIPAMEQLVPGQTGALLDRDRVTEYVPAHTEVYRLEWTSVEAMRNWLDTSEHDGLVADQKMGGERVRHMTEAV
jgi:hypothetical protein